MEDNKFRKLIHIVQDKLRRNSKVYPSMNEYAFSREDLDELKKENIEKLKDLKKNIQNSSNQKKVLNENELDESILNQDNFEKLEEESIRNEDNDEYKEEQRDDELTEKEEIHRPSFIHLEQEHQDLIMSKWREIDLNAIDKDIIEAKELLNHNYTITYADDAARFVHDIRKKYEVVLCYLIGFNNEKKGIYNKTFFAPSMESEWKYLNYYIKLLEKIRNFKNQ